MRKRTSRDEADGDGEAGQLSSSLMRGLGILRAFRPGDSSLGNQDIIARTGLPCVAIRKMGRGKTSSGRRYVHETLH